jgi:hypothetical protein
MRRSYFLLLVCGLLAVGVRSSAQSIRHTTWRAYFLRITDSVTLSFGADSMTAKTDSGYVLLQSAYRDSGNLVTLEDYGGQNACPKVSGKYQIRIMADTLIMILNNDYCDLRSGTLMAKRWLRVQEAVVPPPPAAAKKKRRG